MAVTVSADLADSQVTIYDQAVIVSGQNLANIDADGSVTLGGSINGKDNKFTIYSKLSPVVSALVDGTEVTPVTMVDSSVTIEPKEYGNVISRTRLANSATAGKADLASAKLIGINMMESPNSKAVAILEGATNSTVALSAGTLGKLDLRGAYTKLATAGVLPFEDGMYRVRMNPSQVADLKDELISIAQYTSLDMALRAEVGALEGFRVIQDRAVTAGTVICYGDNAIGKSESYPTSPTIIDGTDNLARMRHYGWYGIYEYGIVDQNAVQLITGA